MVLDETNEDVSHSVSDMNSDSIITFFVIKKQCQQLRTLHSNTETVIALNKLNTACKVDRT